VYNLCSRLVAFCRAALAAAPQPAELSGVFWVQGESDSGAAKHANAYHDNLVEFVACLRRDLCCPGAGFKNFPSIFYIFF